MSASQAILLVQLGTPDEATPEAVRRYLKEFLGDPHVVDINRFLWFIILNCFILPFRPQKSAALYQRLFQEHGPILRTLTHSLSQKLQDKYRSQGIDVIYAMRYGTPSLSSRLKELSLQYQNILVVPLFPQYSNTTTGSIIDRVNEILPELSPKPHIDFIQSYSEEDIYLDCLAQSINQHLDKQKEQPERLLLSYHGIPERYVAQGDPYHLMCLETTERLRPRLNIEPQLVKHCYQSRFGKEPWLQPYTDEVITSLGQQGVKKIAAACPAFSMDCLETLDEIGVESAQVFKENGGESLELIPCLNDQEIWVDGLFTIIEAQRLKN